MTLKFRLLLAIIPLIVLSVLLVAGISLNAAVDGSTQALTNAAEEKLTSQNKQTAQSISDYIQFVESQANTHSKDLSVIDAAKAFIPAYQSYLEQRGQLTSSELDGLGKYYEKDFASLYKERNNRNLSQVGNLYRNLPDTAKALQYDFIAGSSHAIGEKDKLTQLANDSDYAVAHSKYHEFFREFLSEFGYYDIFIADINSGDIVYSVFKELDYATSLTTGPYANTGIADAFNLAKRTGNTHDVHFSTLATYLPSYEAMAGFISAPIMENGETIAVLIFQIPLNVITNLATHQKKWLDHGYGESGETYVVTPEGVLLTESRFFLEDPQGYNKVIQTLSPTIAKHISDAGTSVGLQRVDSIAAKEALNGKSGFQLIQDYRNVDVYSYYQPLKLGPYTYAIMAEIDVEEALRPATQLKSFLINSTIVTVLVLLGIALVVSLWVAQRLVKPLETVGDACKELTSGTGDLTIQLPKSAIPEINRIVDPFNIFISQIRDIVAAVKEDSLVLSSESEKLTHITNQSEQSTAQQRAESNEVDRAIKELAATIQNVAHSTVETRDYGSAARVSLNENMDRADKAGESIKLLVELIQDSSNIISSLKNEVDDISTVLTVLTSIADQTNLLALNAAIEAARAGEAGRGFSVVADEVRALATRSQENTVQIANIIDRMSASSENSVVAMERASRAAEGGIHLVELVTVAMTELGDTLSKVQEMTDVVASASEEQSLTSSSVTDNIARISNLSAEIEDGATQSNQSAQHVSQVAKHASDKVERFIV